MEIFIVDDFDDKLYMEMIEAGVADFIRDHRIASKVTIATSAEMKLLLNIRNEFYLEPNFYLFNTKSFASSKGMIEFYRTLRETHPLNVSCVLGTDSNLVPEFVKNNAKICDFINVEERSYSCVEKRVTDSLKWFFTKIFTIIPQIEIFETKNITYYLNHNEIVYIETVPRSSFSRIYTKSRTCKVPRRLNAFALSQLAGFVKIHASFIVNVRKIRIVDKSKSLVTMIDGSTIPASRKGLKVLSQLKI
ncbi:MAG: LytTR family transcriptional regulator [Lactobacillales bacterium]|jgi:DNA-binding LytR/AlgR family response regulator|nr:LytTR family transcriptional regulator [Lactobacillales bacterium]